MTAATKTHTQTVTVDAGALRAATAWVSRTLPTRPTVPVLGGLVLTAGMGELTMAAFDFETASTITIEADGVTDGPVLVPGRLLADVAAHLTGTATLTIDQSVMIVTSGRRSFRVSLMDPGDYPTVPQVAATSGQIDAGAMQDLLSRAAVAATTIADSNPRLDLVHLVAADGTLTAYSTDRYRAARITVPWDGQDFDAQAPAAVLHSAVKGMVGTVAIGATDSQIVIEARDRTSIVGLIGLEPLPVQRLMAEPRAGTFTVDRAELTAAIAAARVSIDRDQPMVLTTADGALEISGIGDRSQASDVLDVTGELDVTWALNPAFLADLLAALPGERVRFTAHTTRPSTNSFQIVGSDAADEPDLSCTYLLVPMRVNGANR